MSEVDMAQIEKDARELCDKIVKDIQGYSPAIAATALWSVAGSLIGCQIDQNMELLLESFNKNMRKAAFLYRAFIEENPCLHRGEEHEASD